MATELVSQFIEARNAACTLYELALEEAAPFTGKPAIRFWQCLLEYIGSVLPSQSRSEEVLRDQPMAANESKEFEQAEIQFGKHIGTQFKDVPMDYLLWLDDQPDFRRQLSRYLASQRVQAEIPEVDADGN